MTPEVKSDVFTPSRAHSKIAVMLVFLHDFFSVYVDLALTLERRKKNNPVTHKHTQKKIIMQMKRFFLCEFFHRIFFPNLCTTFASINTNNQHTNDATKTVQEKTHPWQKRHFRYFNHISFVSFAFRNSCLNVNFVWELQNKMKLKGKKGTVSVSLTPIVGLLQVCDVDPDV